MKLKYTSNKKLKKQTRVVEDAIIKQTDKALGTPQKLAKLR